MSKVTINTTTDVSKENITLSVFKICGYRLPDAGPAGVSTARALREGLMIARDSDKQVMYSPKKQMLMDKLIRKLAVIPKQGLSAEIDIPEISELAKMVGYTEDKETSDSPLKKSFIKDSSLTSEVDLVVSHKNMKITTGDDTDTLSINSSKHAEDIQPKTTLKKLSSTKSENKIFGQAAVEGVRRQDTVNTIVHPALPKISPAEPALSESSLTALYLSADKYQDFIKSKYSSPADFEKILDVTITQFESGTMDTFESWLGEKYVSPFLLLQRMSVTEVYELAANPDIRAMLKENEIKYETFVAWVDLIKEMQSLAGDDNSMQFGELYAKWMIEAEYDYYQE